MILLISFLIGIQLFHAVASIPHPHFSHLCCHSSDTKTTAELALNKHNKYQTEGYIFGLQRIFDANQIHTKDGNPVLYLTLDVLETKCHVLSQKLWKECEFRHPYETVFGQCNIIIKFNRDTNDLLQFNSACTLHPLSTPACPGCPIRQNPSEETFQEIARESLAKFNAENSYDRYFAIVEVTKASSQVVYGILNAIEFTIHETSCHKSTPVSDISQCSLLSTETAERGLCKGSVISRGEDTPKIVTATCELFPHLSWTEHQELHHLHVNATETLAIQNKATDYPSSTHEVPEVSPTFASLQEEDESTNPPSLKRIVQSPSCPGEVAIKIPGLQLPSPVHVKTSPKEGDAQH